MSSATLEGLNMMPSSNLSPELSQQVMNTMVSKPIMLASEGDVLVGQSEYYSPQNLSVDGLEIVYNVGRYNSVIGRFDGQPGEITIPNQSFIGVLMIHIKLPPLTRTYVASLPTNVQQVFMSAGWGYSMINRIDWVGGQSSVSSTVQEGHTNMMAMITQCETNEKASKMLFELGGRAFIGAEVEDGVSPEAFVFVNLPWSSIHNTPARLQKPFNSALLFDPIRVRIEWHVANKYLMGRDAVGSLGTYLNPGYEAVAYMRQGNYTKTNPDVRGLLNKLPAEIIPYPYFSYNSLSDVVGFDGNTTTGVKLNLATFLNADLMSIVIGIIPQIQEGGSSDPAANQTNPWAYEQISDVELTWNGLVLHKTPSVSNDFFELAQGKSGEGTYDYTDVAPPPVPSNITLATASNLKTNLLTINFTRENQAFFQGHFPNSFRIANNPLVLGFKTKTTAKYTLHANAVYSALLNVNQGRSFVQFS